MSHRIKFKNIWYRYDSAVLFRGLDFRAGYGSGVIIKGDCGSGKTTLLETGAGLVKPDRGEVCHEGVSIFSSGPRKMTQIRKKTGFMFQDNALISNMTLFDNAALPLRYHLNIGAAEVKNRVMKMFSLLGIRGSAGFLPERCNSGELKRAALARALIMKPSLLFLDEPMEGVDDNIKEKIIKVVLDFFRSGNCTIIITVNSFSINEIIDWPVFELKDGGISERG